MVDGQQALVTTLEDLLVREFRAYQSLVVLARAEREALVAGDVEALEGLLAQKGAMTEEAARLEQARRELLRAFAAEGEPQPGLAEVLEGVGGEIGLRLRRLREGIVALLGELRALQRANQALAEGALARLEAARTFLVSLEEPAAGYPSGAPRAALQPAVSLAPERWT